MRATSEPSLPRDGFEGVTTRTYALEQSMKSVQPSGWKPPASVRMMI